MIDIENLMCDFISTSTTTSLLKFLMTSQQIHETYSQEANIVILWHAIDLEYYLIFIWFISIFHFIFFT
jgi:hypothetical protein